MDGAEDNPRHNERLFDSRQLEAVGQLTVNLPASSRTWLWWLPCAGAWAVSSFVGGCG